MFASLHTLTKNAVALVAITAFVLSVAGCGTPSQFGLQAASQNFGQNITFNKKIDLLFVIDTTSSMASKLTQLSSQYPSLIYYFGATGYDLHIAVTTMDMSPSGAQGNFVGSPAVLTLSTPNVSQDFVTNISQGSSGSDLQRGLLAVQTALSPTALAGPNAGFLRSDALLAITFMSDEDDNSTGTPQSYISFLNSLKPPFSFGQPGWIANSIVAPSLSSACTALYQFVGTGTRYMALTTASGGTVESICGADLVQASIDIRDRIGSLLTQYHLDRPADPTSIKVTINGVSIPNDPNNGWTYDATTQLLTFNGSAIPPANGQVQVAYQPLTEL